MRLALGSRKREYDHLTLEDIQASLARAGDALKSERV